MKTTVSKKDLKKISEIENPKNLEVQNLLSTGDNTKEFNELKPTKEPEKLSSYQKGKNTSFGHVNLSHDSFDQYGVKTKRQNGKDISIEDTNLLESTLKNCFEKLIDLSEHFRNDGIVISYSGNKHMYARRAMGLFSKKHKLIGISNIGNINRTLAHEIGHYIDFLLGDKSNLIFATEDETSLAYNIAITFKKNMIKRQTSDYKKRICECFARAIEQYYCLNSSIQINSDDTHFCETNVFNLKVKPLIEQLFKTI